MDKEQIGPGKIITIAIIIVVIVIVIYFIVKPSSDKKDTSELLKGAVIAQQPKVSKGFSVNYFADFCKKNKLIPTKYLKSLGLPSNYLLTTVEAIKEAKGVFNDDEDAIYNIFEQIPNTVTASMISFSFKNKYGTDLRSFLNTFLSESEVQRINKILLLKK